MVPTIFLGGIETGGMADMIIPWFTLGIMEGSIPPFSAQQESSFVRFA